MTTLIFHSSSDFMKFHYDGSELQYACVTFQSPPSLQVNNPQEVPYHYDSGITTSSSHCDCLFMNEKVPLLANQYDKLSGLRENELSLEAMPPPVLFAPLEPFLLFPRHFRTVVDLKSIYDNILKVLESRIRCQYKFYESDASWYVSDDMSGTEVQLNVYRNKSSCGYVIECKSLAGDCFAISDLFHQITETFLE